MVLACCRHYGHRGRLAPVRALALALAALTWAAASAAASAAGLGDFADDDLDVELDVPSGGIGDARAMRLTSGPSALLPAMRPRDGDGDGSDGESAKCALASAEGVGAAPTPSEEAASRALKSATPSGDNAVVAPAPRVQGLRFRDLDLDEEDLGGPITWEPPDDVSAVTGYSVYLATDAVGSERSLVAGAEVPVGTNWVLVPPDTPARAPSGRVYSSILVHASVAAPSPELP
eukprot:TRINITY_DN13364_c0_g1_i1.p1 TRINITY_DN13364_c0_g1~~TRINITY_DN13364_c0_g1_i1.p1  ORF type:complete len:274 (-),score=65.65 TRINITY_DN13364_c0_g1_i1:96-794(-)